MKMKPIHAALAIALAAVALGGCDRDETRTAATKTRQAIDRAAVKTEAALDKAGDKAKALGAQVEKSAEEAAITAKVKADLVKDPELSALAINVDTNGSVVTLNGTAPNPKAAERAQKIAIATQGVTEVRNNLSSGG
jgi:hypothetical protein